jgi:tRNA(Ser,Leu) C12 N-acetylase TAN1
MIVTSCNRERFLLSARVSFADPDYILALETVGQRAGLSLWDRVQRARYPFLGLD